MPKTTNGQKISFPPPTAESLHIHEARPNVSEADIQSRIYEATELFKTLSHFGVEVRKALLLEYVVPWLATAQPQEAHFIIGKLAKYRGFERSWEIQQLLTEILNPNLHLKSLNSLWYLLVARLGSSSREGWTVEPLIHTDTAPDLETVSFESGVRLREAGFQAHLAALPELLKTHSGWHVAYLGEDRVALSKTREAVEKTCLEKELPLGLVVFSIVQPYSHQYVAC